MKLNISILLVAIVVALCPACESAARSKAVQAKAPHQGVQFRREGDGEPTRRLDDVIRFAQATAAKRRPDMNRYHCVFVLFTSKGFGSTKQAAWVVQFEEVHPVPDTDFLVIVEDTSDRVEFFTH